MIDTFQISITRARLPNQIESGGSKFKPLRFTQTGEPTAFCVNGAKGEPRLTISKNRNDWWNIRAEVSVGRWLHGSNLHLPDAEELHRGLDLLSALVRERIGVVFDAHTARVSRVDFTRDFQVGEDAVISIIAKFAKFNLPRYKRVCYEETSVYFKNSLEKGKLTKQFKIYSKYHERLKEGAGAEELEAAKGILRLEVSYQKSAVNRLAKSLKLLSHHANHILTKETSEKVILTAMKQLHFDSLLNAGDSNVEKLFELYGATMPFSLIGFCYLTDRYGADLTRQSFIQTSPKTLRRYADDCNRAGILSLE